jgi:membrane protease YdiL (CAAX protease family)
MMRTETKQIAKQIGRGGLGLLITIVIVILLAKARRGSTLDLGTVVVSALAIAATYLAASRWIERRRPPELNAAGRAAEFGAGLGIGIGLFSTVMAVLWIMGIYRPLGWGTLAGLGSGALIALAAALVEEIMFRAYLFRLLSLATGTWAAVVVTSALFGAGHAANPGATLYSSMAIAVEAGVILAGAYAATGRLWMPIGLHMGWNFAEGTLFGESVSGGAVTSSLSRGTLGGPAILSGGAFGPEASVVAVVLCFAVGVILLWRTVRLGRIQLPMWKAASEPTFVDAASRPSR